MNDFTNSDRGLTPPYIGNIFALRVRSMFTYCTRVFQAMLQMIHHRSRDKVKMSSKTELFAHYTTAKKQTIATPQLLGKGFYTLRDE